MNLNFLHPSILIFAAILLWSIAVYILFFTKKRENFSQLWLIKEVYGDWSFWGKIFFPILLSFLGIIFLLMSLPYAAFQESQREKKGVNIEIVMDLSYSMLAQDMSPNRLEVAKHVFENFVSEREGDKIGLILFAGKPFQSVPMSYEIEFLKEFLSKISTDTIQQNNSQMQGTAIWDALVLAADALKRNDSEREKIIILITDGEANRGVKPELALKFLKESGITTYTIGVGQKWDTSIGIPGPFGIPQEVIVSGVDEEILKKIAQETGGLYGRADSQSAFETIVNTINNLEKRPENYTVFETKKYRIWLLFLLGAFFWLGGFYIFVIRKFRWN